MEVKDPISFSGKYDIDLILFQTSKQLSSICQKNLN